MPIPRYFGRRFKPPFTTKPPTFLEGPSSDINIPPPDDSTPGEIKTVLWLIYTWNQDKPTLPDYNESVFVNKGNNWATWIDALTTRINARGGTVTDEIIGHDAYDKETTIEAAVKLQFKGEAVWDLASMADYVVMGCHHPPVSHAEAIQVRSKQPDGTKIIMGLFNFDSDNQARPWNTELDTVWDANRPSIMYSDEVNSYGCSVLDRYEESGDPTYCPPVEGPRSPGTSHTYVLDIGYVSPAPASVPHHDSWMDAVNYFLEAEGYLTLDDKRPAPIEIKNLDGILVDNVLEYPYFGQATNTPPSYYTTEYMREAWQQLMARATLDYTAVGYPNILWGNSSSSSVYGSSELLNRFIEFSFRRTQGGLRAATWPEIRSMIDDFKAHELFGVLGDLGPPANSYSRIEWFTGTGPGKIGGQDFGTWAQLVDYIRTSGMTDNVAVNCCRTTSGGYLFHQSGFRLPVP